MGLCRLLGQRRDLRPRGGRGDRGIAAALGLGPGRLGCGSAFDQQDRDRIADRTGARVVVAPLGHGMVPDVVSAIDERTRVVAVGHVSNVTGAKPATREQPQQGNTCSLDECETTVIPS